MKRAPVMPVFGHGLELSSKSLFMLRWDRIERWPLAGAKAGRIARVCKVKRFPYGIVYLPRDTEIVVVAVMHLHHRPGYWRRRVKDVGP